VDVEQEKKLYLPFTFIPVFILTFNWHGIQAQGFFTGSFITIKRWYNTDSAVKY